MKHVFQVALETFEHIELENRFLAKKALKNWAKIVGPLLAHKAHPTGYWKNTVYLYVNDGIWKQEILLRKEKILSDLNVFYPEKVLFKDIKITFNMNKSLYI